MRLNRVLVAASLIAVSAAASVRADQKDFLNICTPSFLKACTSVQVITNWNGSVTQVTIRVRNLEGGVFDNTGGSLIRRIGLVAPVITGATGLSVNAVSGATAVGSPAGLWFLSNPGNLGGLITFTAGPPAGGPGTGGIEGCNAPFGAQRSSYFRTCNTGWVELTFTTTNNWSANNSDVAILTTDWANSGGGLECDTDNNPLPRPACVVATPEPVTMILLGSGLASMGGFGLVRRRKGTDVISD